MDIALLKGNTCTRTTKIACFSKHINCKKSNLHFYHPLEMVVCSERATMNFIRDNDQGTRDPGNDILIQNLSIVRQKSKLLQ